MIQNGVLKYLAITNNLSQQLCATCTLGFTIGFSVFLLACVDWSALRGCHDEGSCKDLAEYVRVPFGQASVYNFVTFCYMLLFGLYWVWQGMAAVRAVLEAIKMEAFYKYVLFAVYFGIQCNFFVCLFRRVLGINLADLQNMHWRDVVRRLITLHDSGVFRVTIQDKLTEHDVVSRIMRKDNYMVALINKVLRISVQIYLILQN